MGKTSKPLAILVHPDIAHWPEWDALRAQGHVVHTIPSDPSSIWGYDLMAGPKCWRMSDALKPYLDMALNDARVGRFGKETKKNAKKTD